MAIHSPQTNLLLWDNTPDGLTASVFPKKRTMVFSAKRTIHPPKFDLPKGYNFNTRMKMDGIQFLSKLPKNISPVAFFDPQYRGILDKLIYGNEGKDRGRGRCSLPQMSEELIQKFIVHLDDILIPSGHLFLWMDKFQLCKGLSSWLQGTKLDVVDMLTWDKGRIGMGYRTRRSCEYLIVLQKPPRRAKGVWKIHNIPDVLREKVERKGHPHRKPLAIQSKLMEAVSNEKDVVVDPAAGSFSVMEACKGCNRLFLGCDING